MDTQPLDIGEKLGTVTVYGKPGCPACTRTTRTLDKEAIPYTYIDFTENEAAYEILKANNVLAAPYVVSPVGSWSGFNDERLEELAESR